MKVRCRTEERRELQWKRLQLERLRAAVRSLEAANKQLESDAASAEEALKACKL